MTSLGLVGIADKGTYNAEATYNKGQFVLYDGSTWLALKDNLNGVTPAEGENWKYLARGFAAELLSLVTAIDSQGLSGSQGGQVNAQSLIDVLADKVANQLIAKSMMSNVQVNDAEKVPTSALAYAMQQSIETLNSNLSNFQSENAKLVIGKVDNGPYMYLINKITNSLLMLRMNEEDKSIAVNAQTNGAWGSEKLLATKDYLGVTQYNGVDYISLSGKLSNIGEWVKNNGTPGKCTFVRVEPSDSDGYFGTSGFSILWMRTSVNYGWCILISDNPRMVVFGRNSTGWHWYAPSLTEVS